MAWFAILKFSKNLYDRPITKKFRKTKNVQLLCQIQENTKCTNVFVKFRKIQNVQTSLCYIVQIISYAGIVYNLRKRVFFWTVFASREVHISRFNLNSDQLHTLINSLVLITLLHKLDIEGAK